MTAILQFQNCKRNVKGFNRSTSRDRHLKIHFIYNIWLECNLHLRFWALQKSFFVCQMFLHGSDGPVAPCVTQDELTQCKTRDRLIVQGKDICQIMYHIYDWGTK
jgi:hypothetical protein